MRRCFIAIFFATLSSLPGRALAQDAPDFGKLADFIRWSGVLLSVFVIIGAIVAMRVVSGLANRFGERFASRRMLISKVESFTRFLLYIAAGVITLAGSRLYTSMADTDDVIDDAVAKQGPVAFRHEQHTQRVEQCSTCHRVAGEGGRIGPDLSRIGAARSHAALTREIRTPHDWVPPGFETVTMMALSPSCASILVRRAEQFDDGHDQAIRSVDYLLSHGADVNARSASGSSLVETISVDCPSLHPAATAIETTPSRFVGAATLRRSPLTTVSETAEFQRHGGVGRGSRTKAASIRSA